MPLRDHFRPPVSNRLAWHEFHGMWPAVIVQHLKTCLPPTYLSTPTVRLGAHVEVDIATHELDEFPEPGSDNFNSGGTALALAPWRSTAPSLTIETNIPAEDEFQVRVYDARHGRRLVAVIELVSPANKDRTESRNAFIAKCAALLRAGVAVNIVDVVTVRQNNLYAELLAFLGQPATGIGTETATYAVSCRWLAHDRTGRLEAWAYPLSVDQTMPTLPLWLTPKLAIALDLEACYEKTCSDLRIN